MAYTILEAHITVLTATTCIIAVAIDDNGTGWKCYQMEKSLDNLQAMDLQHVASCGRKLLREDAVKLFRRLNPKKLNN